MQLIDLYSLHDYKKKKLICQDVKNSRVYTKRKCETEMLKHFRRNFKEHWTSGDIKYQCDYKVTDVNLPVYQVQTSF